MSERSFVDCYPFLPHQIRLAQDIFEAVSGFRISGGVRSMISVVMETLQDLADKELGVVVSFDQVFDTVENDLLSQEYLGASGVRAIRDAPLRQLPLQVLVPVDAQLRVVREVRTELQEERPEVVVEHVEVEVVHHRRRVDQPRVDRPGRAPAALSALHPCLLLRLADVEHALATAVRELEAG